MDTMEKLERAEADYMYTELNWFDHSFKKELQANTTRLNYLSGLLNDKQTNIMSCYGNYRIEHIAASKQYFDMLMLELEVTYVRLRLNKQEIKATKKAIREAKRNKDIDTVNYLSTVLAKSKQSLRKHKDEFKYVYNVINTMINNAYLTVEDLYYC